MLGALKWLLGLGLVATVGVGAGVYFAFFGTGQQITYVTPDLVPISASGNASCSRSRARALIRPP